MKRLEQEQEQLMELENKLEFIIETQKDKQSKHNQHINQISMKARSYSEMMNERVELLKVIEIVKKIESENSYLDKIKKIED